MAEYISRETMIKLLQSMADNAEANGFSYDREVIESVMATLAGIPAADVAQVVHGGWIPLFESEISGWNPEFSGKDPIGGYMCSVCKEEAIYDCNDEFVLSKFCPNCGAKMDEEVQV